MANVDKVLVTQWKIRIGVREYHRLTRGNCLWFNVNRAEAGRVNGMEVILRKAEIIKNLKLPFASVGVRWQSPVLERIENRSFSLMTPRNAFDGFSA